ncbi:MAG: 16S rRNA (cytidine(1402)-2'-O)-methyltransferase [Oscillospiraceae bacterium]|nr:16S rRNA (cytidine(1402)-2'-O)-methyltransferase [Oscillospiraceae bacterium]
MSGTLYLVGTPIGNLGDMSPRAAETLQLVDFIAAEDTRVSLKLLNHLGIKKPLVSYYAHNRRDAGEKILQRLQAGESCALVSDAGMPAISDPGEELVALCGAVGIQVCCVPGPSAVVTALALSGLPSGRFTFEGFLSTARKSRMTHLAELKDERRTMIFYEAPHKLPATLQDMLDAWGDRNIALGRELTKRYEETLRTTLSQAAARFATEKPRGEFVLIIEGALPAGPDQDGAKLEQAIERLRELMDTGISVKDAVRQCAAETGVAKNILYAEAVRETEAL